MKVTALLPDELISKVKKQTGGRNLTDCLVIALKEWLALRNIRGLNRMILSTPLRFKNGFSAEVARKINRQS